MSELLKRIQTSIVESPHTPYQHDGETALAWLKGEIRGYKIAEALGMSKNYPIYPWLAQSLRLAYQQGLIEARAHTEQTQKEQS